MSGTPAGLACERVSLRRGGRLLFEDLSFTLAPGAGLLVTGRNGAGKSSVLRLAAGLLPPSAGEVQREGSMALADERPALDPDEPLVRALAYWARFDGGDAAAALASTGLAHLAEIPVRLLSTGQRRRATLARVLVQRADIWLLDEPANGLDADAVARLEALIAEHRAGGGIALIASHQPLALPGAQTMHLC